MTLQSIFAPLILTENLHSRLSDQLEMLDTLLADIPSEFQTVRLVVIESIRILRTAVHTLESQRVVCYLTIHRRFAQYIQTHGHLPAIEDIDDSSDSQP